MAAIIATASATFADLTRRVLDYDPAMIASVGTDFCLDFSQDRCFIGGRPAEGAAVVGGVTGLTIAAAGGGGTPGTYLLAFSGGGGTGATGTATVGSGGALTATSLTNAGSGYTSAPTVTIPGAGLVSANIGSTINAFRNLARDVNPILARTGRVMAMWNATGSRPTRNGNGLRMLPTTQTGAFILKDGVVNNRVMEPSLEGFVDHLLTLVMRPAAFAIGASPFQAGIASGNNQYAGFAQSSTAGSYLMQPGAYTEPGWMDNVAVGALAQIGVLVRYNTVAGTTSIHPIRDGQLRSTPRSGLAPSAYPTNIANASARIGGGGTSGPAVFDGTIYRVYREIVGALALSGADLLDYAARKVAREWAYAQAAFA